MLGDLFQQHAWWFLTKTNLIPILCFTANLAWQDYPYSKSLIHEKRLYCTYRY
jgi:hypothetical protein